MNTFVSQSNIHSLDTFIKLKVFFVREWKEVENDRFLIQTTWLKKRYGELRNPSSGTSELPLIRLL